MTAELNSRFGHNLVVGWANSRRSTAMICHLAMTRTGEAAMMMGAARLAIADTFVDAIIRLELDQSRDMVARYGSTRYFVYPNGRAGSTFTHEFFPYDVPAHEAIQFAQALASHSPHMLSPMAERIRDETSIYEAAGYERVAEWTLMVRPLTHEVSQSGDERAMLIGDAATE